MENANHYNLCIIGGDAAGLAAATAAADKNPERSICVFERNVIFGRKLNATGNGRCNYLNKYAVPEKYWSGSAPEAAAAVLDSVFDKHPVMQVAEWFSGIGIIPAEEDEGRLYPRSFQAKSVSDALIKAAERRDVELISNFSVSYINRKGDRFEVVSDTGSAVTCEHLLLACGGKAGLQYGCFGDGYRFAKALGHTVVKPIPALTQLTVDGIEELFGVRVKCRISLCRKAAQTADNVQKPAQTAENVLKPAQEDSFSGSCLMGPDKNARGTVDYGCGSSESAEKIVASDSGELQFTKDSLSGICTFNVSRFFRISPEYRYVAKLDLFEEYTLEELTGLLESRYSYFGFLKDTLAGLLPDKLIEYILGKYSASPAGLAAVCKALPFNITGSKSFKDAQVTSGGINLAELDPETLESRLCPGLYFAGELLDIDAPCGGYNLSFAFASGLLAGENA